MNGNNTPLSEMLGISMEKVKEMADVNSIIGEPINLDNGVTIIPISKVSYGFGGGGSDIPSKYDKNLFGGGAGAGVFHKARGFPRGFSRRKRENGSHGDIGRSY